jgi:hypothetical protein
MRTVLLMLCAIPNLVLAQDRPAEADLFGDDAAPVESAALAPATTPQGVNAATSAPDGGLVRADDRDAEELSGKGATSRFDTKETISDPLAVGGTLNVFAQGFWHENRAFEKGTLAAPFIFDAFLDGRPNDRLRAYIVARLQFDPTRPIGSGASSAAGVQGGAASVGLAPSTRDNPYVALDQLWLRFDLLRTLYLTVGKQKVRWGVSRIWYPTDFLNSQPRDALSPFDARLGVNLLKVHLPIERLGWNFYAYGLLDSPKASSSGLSIEHLGGAIRGEIVMGPAEIGVGGVWQNGRRPRYGIDVSSALGPVDVYAEAAIRDSRDFLLFRYPDDLDDSTLLAKVSAIEPYRNDGPTAQVSGGASWQFNYTDSNFAVLGVEYFFNPAGYTSVAGNLVQTFAPALTTERLDPVQQLPLYAGRHNLAVSLASPGLPQFSWITLSLSNIIVLSDPSALTRIDAIFRVLSNLNVQVFAAVLYGQTGGQLRFRLSPKAINDIAGIAEAAQPGSGDSLRTALEPLRNPPLMQAGVVLRLSI